MAAFFFPRLLCLALLAFTARAKPKDHVDLLSSKTVNVCVKCASTAHSSISSLTCPCLTSLPLFLFLLSSWSAIAQLTGQLNCIKSSATWTQDQVCFAAKPRSTNRINSSPRVRGSRKSSTSNLLAQKWKKNPPGTVNFLLFFPHFTHIHFNY